MFKIHMPLLMASFLLIGTINQIYCSEEVISSAVASHPRVIEADGDYKTFIRALNGPVIVNQGVGFTSTVPASKCLVLKISSHYQADEAKSGYKKDR